MALSRGIAKFLNGFATETLVFLLGVVLNVRSLDGGFVFDDNPAIVENDDVYAHRTTISQVLGHNFWGQPQGDPSAMHHSCK